MKKHILLYTIINILILKIHQIFNLYKQNGKKL